MFWDISDFGYEILGKILMREKRCEREKGYGFLESIVYIDFLVLLFFDVNRFWSICWNVV